MCTPIKFVAGSRCFVTNLDAGMKSLQVGPAQTGWKAQGSAACVHESCQTVLMGTPHQSCWETPGRAAATG